MRRSSRPAVPPDPETAPRDAYAQALRWLSLRELSASAMCKRLAEKGFSPDIIDATIARLQSDRALDDARAVRACARTLVTIKRRGRQRAQRELEAMGFGAELARAALADALGDEDEHAMAARVLAGKMRGARIVSDPAAYQRLYGALLRRGFSAAIARSVLKPVWKRGAEVPETDID